MPKGYWVTCYRSIKDPDKLAAYAKLAAVGDWRRSASNISCADQPGRCVRGRASSSASSSPCSTAWQKAIAAHDSPAIRKPCKVARRRRRARRAHRRGAGIAHSLLLLGDVGRQIGRLVARQAHVRHFRMRHQQEEAPARPRRSAALGDRGKRRRLRRAAASGRTPRCGRPRTSAWPVASPCWHRRRRGRAGSAATAASESNPRDRSRASAPASRS